MKKIFTIAFLICVIYMNHSLAQNERECFEKVSRGIFKFNQGFDNVDLSRVLFIPVKLRSGCENPFEFIQNNDHRKLKFLVQNTGNKGTLDDGSRELD